MPEAPFRPQARAARVIYDAFQSEAEKRPGRSPEAWEEAEIETVYRAAVGVAASEGVDPPSKRDIRDAAIKAMGHVDYGATWAHEVVRLIALKRNPESA